MSNSSSQPRGNATEPRPNPTAAAAAPRRRPTAIGCLKALAMLAQNPITHIPIPRLHVSPVKQTGVLTVLDRASGDRFAIYTPKFEAQFRAGHRAGLWYARPVNNPGAQPVSRGFATAKQAIDALKQGRWQPPGAGTQAGSRHPLRILWSNPAGTT